jgi:hypothetical protein
MSSYGWMELDTGIFIRRGHDDRGVSADLSIIIGYGNSSSWFPFFFVVLIRGRQITQTGQRDLDRIAAQVASKSSS